MFCGQQGFAGGFTFLRQACSIFLAKHSKKASSTFTSLVKKLPFVAGSGVGFSASDFRFEGFLFAFAEVVGMPETELVSYGSDIAAGLSYLHSLRPKILHRDVKPASILLFASQERVFNFGLILVLL
eukprot:g30168.t1